MGHPCKVDGQIKLQVESLGPCYDHSTARGRYRRFRASESPKNLQGSKFASTVLLRDLKSFDLSFSDFRFVQAIGRDFSQSVLQNGNFKGIIAPHSVWSMVNAESIDLRAAKLRFSNWQGAKLNGAQFQYADLSFTNFRDADLRGAIFEKAIFLGADFTGAKIDENTQLPKKVLDNMSRSQ